MAIAGTLAVETKLQALLGKLRQVTQTGPNSWKALCPAHDDKNPSLSITLEGEKILIHCFAGCEPRAILKAIGENWSALFVDKPQKPRLQSGLCLSELAAAKKLPVSFLKELGVRDSRRGKPHVCIPYYNEKKDVIAVRRRHALTGDKRFSWRKGDKPCLYGLWRLPEIRKAGWVLLVEGESDCWTAWFHGIPALGIPGKGCWKSECASYLNGLSVYLWCEPDAADLVERVYKDIPKLRVIRPPEDAKDLSDLHVKGSNVPAEIEELLQRTEPPPIKAKPVKAEPVSMEVFNLSDSGNAERLVAKHGQDLRYCHPWKQWLIWDGQRWCPDNTAEVVRRATDVVRAMYARAAQLPDEARKELVRHALRTEQKDRLLAMVSLAACQPGIPILPENLDNNPWLLNVKNGTINLKTGELQPHKREDFITKLAPVEYDPDAKCPRWLQFLDEIMAGNENLVAFLQRAVGLSLTGDTSEHVLFILYGTGRNGKSTFLRTIQALLGPDYAAQATPDLLLVRRGEHHPTELADLYGKRFVACIETAEGRRLAETVVKWLTGGDRIKARRMREDFWEFAPTHKIWMATNHKPQVRGTDLAIWSRLKLIPFTVSFPEEKQDKWLLEKLMAELPGILRWAVEGCLLWQQAGLGIPEEVKSATETYRSEQDILAAFLADYCVVTPSAKTYACELYKAYTAWCAENGEQPISQRAFGTRLIERGFTKTRMKRGFVWHGVGLQTEE